MFKFKGTKDETTSDGGVYLKLKLENNPIGTTIDITDKNGPLSDSIGSVVLFCLKHLVSNKMADDLFVS